MDKNNKPVIILTGGGSGGHITPLLSLAPEIKRLSPNSRLIYIGLKGEKIVGLDQKFAVFDESYHINSGKFRRYHGDGWLARLFDFKTFILNVQDFFKVIRGIFEARKLMKGLKPDIVFSKGGYVVVPVGIAARLSKVPIITHDSDAVPGLANRLIGRWAVIHATGMPPENYDYPKTTIRYTGIPVSESIKPVTDDLQVEMKLRLGLKPEDLILLIGGAGHGSQTLNNLMLATAPQLLKEFPTLHIFHLTGDKHETETLASYNRVLSKTDQSRLKVIGFTAEFNNYSAAADLVVTRAGATALAEYAVQGKACVVLPSPWLAGGHQLKNAKQLEKSTAAVVVDDDVSTGEFYGIIDKLLRNPQQRHSLATKLGQQAKPGAAKLLAEIILSEACKKATNYSV